MGGEKRAWYSLHHACIHAIQTLQNYTLMPVVCNFGLYDVHLCARRNLGDDNDGTQLCKFETFPRSHKLMEKLRQWHDATPSGAYDTKLVVEDERKNLIRKALPKTVSSHMNTSFFVHGLQTAALLPLVLDGRR